MSQAIPGKALSFSGASDVVNVTTAGGQDNMTALSVSFWMYRTGAGGGNIGRIFTKGTNTYFMVRVDHVSGRIGIFSDWSGTDLLYDVSHSTMNAWVHVVFTVSNITSATPTVTCYINGVSQSFVTSQTATGSQNADTSNLYIGNNSAGTRNFAGYIDDLRLYNRVISSTEAADIYAGNASTSGRVGHWKMDEGTGSSTADDTGTASAGTITGATWVTGIVGGPAVRTAAGARIAAGTRTLVS